MSAMQSIAALLALGLLAYLAVALLLPERFQ
jgi:K+-transporting ATPase KdpF subunit